MFSVIVLSKNREKLLWRLLKSIDTADNADNLVKQVIVVENGEGGVGPLAMDYLDKNPKIKMLSFKNELTLGQARNIAVEQVTEAWLVFLDDDVYLPRDYFCLAEQFIVSHPETKILGGPNITPNDSNLFQFLSGEVLGLSVTAGPSADRYLPREKIKVVTEASLILCNLIVNRGEFCKYQFDPHIRGGEENLLLGRMEKKGVPLHYHPQLHVFHERRSNLRGFARQMIIYGQGRGQNMRRGNYKYFHCLPLLGLSSLIMFTPLEPSLPLRLLLTYVITLLILTFHEVKKRQLVYSKNNFFKVFGLVLVVHFCYAIGMIKGLILRS